MNRRLGAILLVVFLMIASVSATAETQVRSVQARSVEVSRLTDVLILQEENSDYYKLITPDGQDLTGAIYTNIREASNYPFFQVSARSSVDGVHDEGLLDLNGNTVIPTEYADIQVFSDRWQAGIKLVPSIADDKDYTFTNYSTDEKSFYKISTVDFYFDGQKVGTLNRSEYGDDYASAYGAYICVINRSKEPVFYNSHMEKSPYMTDSRSEYNSIYKNGKTKVYHNGTGQLAFDPSCTLQPDEVEKPYLYDGGILYGLQGQQIFKPAQNYDNISSFKDGYANVSMNRSHGVIDEQGNEVIPVEYDDVSYNFPVKYGYVGVVKDGKFGYVDLNGNVTCDFTYSNDIVRDHGTFASITNLDGSTIVLSAAVGELPEHYKETTFPGYEGCMAFIAENTNGEQGVVDLYGNTVVPFSEDNRYIDINNDGTVCVVNQDYHSYLIYCLDIPNTFSAATAPQGEDVVAAPASQVAADSWTCENGHAGNTGKFCTECGLPAPVQKPVCKACGYVFEEEQAPKYCPECGAAQ